MSVLILHVRTSVRTSVQKSFSDSGEIFGMQVEVDE